MKGTRGATQSRPTLASNPTRVLRNWTPIVHTRRTCSFLAANAAGGPRTGGTRFRAARRQTQSTVGPGHSTVGPGPQFCGSRATVLWCSQSDPAATHTNVECSHSTRRRHSNIAHVTHRQLSCRIRGIQVSTSELSARRVLECACVAPTVLWVCFT